MCNTTFNIIPSPWTINAIPPNPLQHLPPHAIFTHYNQSVMVSAHLWNVFHPQRGKRLEGKTWSQKGHRAHSWEEGLHGNQKAQNTNFRVSVLEVIYDTCCNLLAFHFYVVLESPCLAPWTPFGCLRCPKGSPNGHACFWTRGISCMWTRAMSCFEEQCPVSEQEQCRFPK